MRRRMMRMMKKRMEVHEERELRLQQVAMIVAMKMIFSP